MSVRGASWWGTFVSGLRTRPLAALAYELGVDEELLFEALIEGDSGGPAEDEAWWPEALRLRGTLGLRALARRFDTEPRRIRRALARIGLRAAGEELDGRGVPALARLRDRLGRAPDAVLAREAGVAVEAVQGERRRLGIAPFRGVETPPAPVLTEEEEAWIRGPEPVRRQRIRPDDSALEVVRRPMRSAGAERRYEARPERSEGGRYEARPERSEGGRYEARPERSEGGRYEARPERSEGERRYEARPDTRSDTRGELPPGRPDADVAAAGSPRWSEPEGVRRVSREFFRERGRDELERLLQPGPRVRDGRQRIVRADAPRSAPGEASGGPVSWGITPSSAPRIGEPPRAPARPDEGARHAALPSMVRAFAPPPPPLQVVVRHQPPAAGPTAPPQPSSPPSARPASPASALPASPPRTAVSPTEIPVTVGPVSPSDTPPAVAGSPGSGQPDRAKTRGRRGSVGAVARATEAPEPPPVAAAGRPRGGPAGRPPADAAPTAPASLAAPTAPASLAAPPAAAPTAPAPIATAPPVTPADELVLWTVQLAGGEPPMQIHASDVVSAAVLAAARMRGRVAPGTELAVLSIGRAGAPEASLAPWSMPPAIPPLPVFGAL